MKKVRSKLRPTEIGVIKTFSLSPDDEVGEIAVECTGGTYYYNNLSELCENWEDYEEPEKYFWIDTDGFIVSDDISTKDVAFETFKKNLNSIGNYFEAKEEAELAVRKLKAWKRLKDKGFKFEGWDNTDRSTIHNFSLFVAIEDLDSINKDLGLLFGGEE